MFLQFAHGWSVETNFLARFKAEVPATGSKHVHCFGVLALQRVSVHFLFGHVPSLQRSLILVATLPGEQSCSCFVVEYLGHMLWMQEAEQCSRGQEPSHGTTHILNRSAETAGLFKFRHGATAEVLSVCDGCVVT